MTQTWHADDETLRSWSTGSATPMLAASVEAHLLRCAECRRRTAGLGTTADTAPAANRTASDTARRWDALADEIDRPRSIPLLRLGLATPSLRAAWLGSVLLLLALPALAVMVGGRLPAMMALAPLAPLAAVAAAYGRSLEPAGELALATPTAGLRVVASRAVLVATTAVPFGVLGALAIGLSPAVAFGWLLPGAALAGLVLLAGTTRLEPAPVAAALGLLWAVAVCTPAAVRRVPADVVVAQLTSEPAQLTALTVALAATLLTVARRDAVVYRRTA